jgi:hypothetical protein
MVSAAVKSIFFFIFSNIFHYFKRPGRLFDHIQPPVLCATAFFLGVKRLEREADHSPPPNAEVKNRWSYTSIPPVNTFLPWAVELHSSTAAL